MNKILILVLLFTAYYNASALPDSTAKTTDYSFIIQDSPAQLFTMKQFDQCYLSAYRLFARGLNSITDNAMTSDLIQLCLEALVLTPLSHEEGHRSILTSRNIGSVSQPYFNESGAAYVKGVTDATLKNLRDTDLPTYIRLHTAGLESDYMLTKQMEAIGSFGFDDYKNYKWEYLMRKLAILQYYVMGLFKYDIDLAEESNELERDIVGFDTYGAVKNLYRPNAEFHRYIRYEDLTREEQLFISRAGYRSLINLLNPMIIGKENFKLNNETSINVGMGYTMSPFGDFIDENIWVKYKSLNFALYARQAQNKENWFSAYGVGLVDYRPIERVSVSLAGHIWRQPKNLDFNTAKSFSGGAVDLDVKYFLLNQRKTIIKGISFDLNFLFKTKGFMPENMFLGKHFGLSFGSTVRI